MAMAANPTIAESVTRTRAALMMFIFSVIFGGLYCVPMEGKYQKRFAVQAEMGKSFSILCARREVFSHLSKSPPMDHRALLCTRGCIEPSLRLSTSPLMRRAAEG